MSTKPIPARIVHCTGSPVDEKLAELSRLYATGALAALGESEHSVDRGWDHVVLDVSPDGSWRFPTSLRSSDLRAAEPLDPAAGLAHLATLNADVGVPQLFCRPGLTDHRALLSLLVRRGDPAPALSKPVVVKPVDADNSTGVRLVDDTMGLAHALEAALELSSAALVEDFVPLGREVRCGTVRHNGELLALPLEEYAVDPVTKPIRGEDDKLARNADGDLRLVAKDGDHAWIVADHDPVVPAVQALARTVHLALGCVHHGLVDVRVDPDGRPWFLEAGPYCSFAPSSVVVMMAAAAGIELADLFIGAVDLAMSSAKTPVAVP